MSTTRQARSEPSIPFNSSGPASSTTRLASCETVRGRADEDLSGARGLLEPRGEIDRLAGRECRLGAVDDDLARLDPDPGLELELVHGPSHRERRACRAQRVVLVGLRNAECRHHGVSRELLDDAPVLDDARGDVLEELVDTPAHDLGVGAGYEARRVDDVDEQNGCELALHD